MAQKVKRVFADTFYWLAVLNPADQWHIVTRETVAALGELHIVTTDEVLTEFLAGMSNLGRHIRLEAVQTLRDILTDEDVIVLLQTHLTFLDGLALNERRADKGYSLTDCISKNACRQQGISEILTNDHHFTQEGFVVLVNL